MRKRKFWVVHKMYGRMGDNQVTVAQMKAETMLDLLSMIVANPVSLEPDEPDEMDPEEIEWANEFRDNIEKNHNVLIKDKAIGWDDEEFWTIVATTKQAAGLALIERVANNTDGD